MGGSVVTGVREVRCDGICMAVIPLPRSLTDALRLGRVLTAAAGGGSRERRSAARLSSTSSRRDLAQPGFETLAPSRELSGARSDSVAV